MTDTDSDDEKLAPAARGMAAESGGTVTAAEPDFVLRQQWRSRHPSNPETVSRFQEETNALKIPEKAAYVQAMSCCPEIVHRESNLFLFLRHENFNFPAATRRLALHWKHRLEYFKDRAWRPLFDFSGNGALTSDDIEKIKLGFLAKLPADNEGRPVICVDRNRLDGMGDEVNSARMRILFFWLSFISGFANVQDKGFVVLRVTRGQSIGRSGLAKVKNLVRDAMPLSIAAFHICSLPPPGGQKSFSDVVIPIVLQLMQRALGRRANVHTASTGAEMLEKLKPFGLKKDSLPRIVGGSWSYEKLDAIILQLSARFRNGEGATADVQSSDAGNNIRANPATGDEFSYLTDRTVSIRTRHVETQNRKFMKRKMDMVQQKHMQSEGERRL
jgi:hypothetical protein